jgi:ATP-dependent RNA helicase DeaD
MVVYRVAVGREHGIEARHLVGAIANEAGLDSQHIGAIRFHERHSTVELPPGMPKEILRHLQKVQVCGKPLMIAPERARPERDAAPAAERKPRKRLTLDGQRAPDKPKRVFTKRPAKR